MKLQSSKLEDGMELKTLPKMHNPDFYICHLFWQMATVSCYNTGPIL